MKSKKDKGIPCSNMREFDVVMSGASEAKPQHTPTPWHSASHKSELRMMSTIGGADGIQVAYTTPENAAFIVRAVNAHDELLEAAKNARNVLAGLVTCDLKEIKADSPALLALRAAIAKAEGR